MLGFAPLGRFALGQGRSASATLVAADAGAYTLTGQAALFSISVPIDAGAYTLTGRDINAVFSIAANAGSYTLSGNAAQTIAGASLYCSPYPQTRARFVGFAPLGGAALGQGRSLDIGTTYRLSGADVTFQLGLRADAGSYTIAGQAARLVEGHVLTALGGTYSLTGQDANFAVVSPLDAGSYSLTGKVIDLTRFFPKIRAFPRVGAAAFGAKSQGRDSVKMKAFGG